MRAKREQTQFLHNLLSVIAESVWSVETCYQSKLAQNEMESLTVDQSALRRTASLHGPRRQGSQKSDVKRYPRLDGRLSIQNLK